MIQRAITKKVSELLGKLKSDTHLHLVYGGNENQTRTDYSVSSILNLPQL